MSGSDTVSSGRSEQTTVACSFYEDGSFMKDVAGTWLCVLLWDDFRFHQQ